MSLFLLKRRRTEDLGSFYPILLKEGSMKLYSNKVLSLLTAAMVICVPAVKADDLLRPSFPTVPPAYEELHAGSMVADAKVNFPAYYIDWTNGYKVTAPSGNQFIVDNIVQPKCAFYATYVNNDENGYLGLSGGNNTAINSKVYIGEVNFDNCK